MSNYKVEQVHGAPMCFMGQSPFWDVDQKALLYTDAIGGCIYKYDQTTERHTMAKIQGEFGISFIIPIHGQPHGNFIIGSGKRLLSINWDGTSPAATITQILGEVSTDGVRFSTAKCDPKGRMFVGTKIDETVNNGKIFDLNQKIASLYAFTSKIGIEVKGQVGLSNGISWNEATEKMYWVDSYDLNVKEFDYDRNSGQIMNEKIFCDLSKHGKLMENVPFGLASDIEGNIYVAMFGGSNILKINQQGEVEQEIKLPTQQITNMCFGGPGLDTLFVTTAGQNVVGQQNNHAGYLFKISNLVCKGTENKMFSMEI